MLKQNLGFGLVTLITVVASGLFAACGEEADTPDVGSPTTSGTGTGTTMPTVSGTAMPTVSGTAMPTVSGTAMPTVSSPMPTASDTAMPTTTMTMPMPTASVMPMPTGDAVAGEATYASSGCGACHGASGEGGPIAPNVTGSMLAGIGGLSYPQFEAAVRDGTDPRGGILCAVMTKYPEATLSAEAMANLYAYLMTEMNDTVMPGGCAN